MTLKLNGSSSGSVSIDAPASTTSGADITFKLPVADGTANQILSTDGSGNLSWVDKPANPISVITTFHQTSNQTGTKNPLTAWAEESGQQSTGKISTGGSVSHSSGVFTFPVTGIYLIMFQASFGLSGDTRWLNNYIVTTNDNGSNWDDESHSTQSITQSGGDNTYTQSCINYSFDVQDVTTHKVQFRQVMANSSTVSVGSSGQNTTAVTFIRLGDT